MRLAAGSFEPRTHALDSYIQRNYATRVDGLRFTWDRRKATANQRKHRVSFDEAESVFFDENAILLDDPGHSQQEDRFVLLGLSDRLRIVVVSHTLRDAGRTIRIISARKATREEREQYFERVMP